MKILVTGGAGYIGSHAVRQLLHAHHDIVVLDNLSHGHREHVDPQAHFIEGDVGDEKLLNEIFLTLHIQAVLHFAADIEVAASVRNPYLYYHNNFVASLTLLNAMRNHNIRRLVFSSTAAVYGNPLAIPIEEGQLLHPINPYGRAKMMVELALGDFCRAYGLGYAILRYFNVAGAAPDGSIGEDHRPESHLIPRILSVAQGHSPSIAVYGTDYPTPDGTCIRDYLHVEDLVHAHLLALEHVQAGVGHIYNLGSEHGFSVFEVIAACERVSGKTIPIQATEQRPGDPAVLIASSEKIKRELGWQRRYPDLETMIAHAWNWQCRHDRVPMHPTNRTATDTDQGAAWKNAF